MTIPLDNSLLIGPAGWNYKDWRGIVYPQHRPRGFQELHYLADFFNLVEINSTFYKIPALDSVANWLEQIRDKKNFRFSLKLFQQFTHADYPPQREQINDFCAILERLQRESRLAALLIQFPWRFKQTAENRAALFKLLNIFADFPRAIEFRHDSWMTEDTFDRLRQADVGFVNIDEPPHNHALPPSSIVTTNFAYLRLHGRNAAMWFNDSSTVAQRYDYLYNAAEMESIYENIKAIRNKTAALFIIFNNHYRGQAVVNALQLMAHLGDQPLIPVTLIDHYPQLACIGRSKADEQLSLF
ncbi:DUF72 domain-containing protein [candidate division KSB1 bacterium]|nr:DUF72 domain-containing protein [candidate division KSB1 bacterium]RQW05363.1 MAG: DUF72 domain-containing protein [candidate division KSB1 bacterium]